MQCHNSHTLLSYFFQAIMVDDQITEPQMRHHKRNNMQKNAARQKKNKYE